MATAATEIKPKLAPKFYCSFCNYTTCKKGNYNSHILTAKHKKHANGNILATAATENKPESSFTCEKCNKNYKDRTGLWKHKKTCLEKTLSEPITTECVLELIKQNKELQNTIVEQCKTIAELANKPTSVTNNNRFNINLFLNEQCKNAMNISDFVSSLKLTLQDLEKTAELGYVKGLTNIIVNGLNELDVYTRPIHCSDLKRETLYVKDNDSWEKDNSEKAKITRMIKHISYRNAKQVGAWTRENKGYNDPESKKNDKYMKIVSEANSGEPHEVEKIISNITPKITIDKESLVKGK